MYDTSHQLEGGPAAQTLPLTAPTLDDALSRELLELSSALRLTLPVIGVSVTAQRRQDAEVLSESAWLPLDSAIERVESLLESHVWRHAQREAHT